MYLCYDIRGIQAFVFQIPRLKYIIGGSALIDRFDRETVPELARKHGWKRVCSGGGKGAFFCASEHDAEVIRDVLIEETHGFGADIRFGQHKEYSEAAHCADRLYPFLPENLQGHPCPESGLYPVEDETVHPVVKRRLKSNSETMPQWFENRLLKSGQMQLPLDWPSEKLSFFRDVDEGTAGCRALGSRNRWAVICMDGNDMGNQFRVRMEQSPSETELLDWIAEIGRVLDECSEGACQAGINSVLRDWMADECVRCNLKNHFTDRSAVVLPIRPLVVGGDDIAVLCHSSYAAGFVSAACRSFESLSRAKAQDALARNIELWPATGGSVTISAGILYCGTSLPLASAIPYAESLLAMAKAKGRELRTQTERGPSPACVDFETLTESLVDHPATRRKRQGLMFHDKDIDERVELTARPYTIEGFEKLLAFDVFKNENGDFLPGNILHDLHHSLGAAFYDRAVYRHRLGKHHGRLAAALDESPEGRFPEKSRWRRSHVDNDTTIGRVTDILDMALLLQENCRMTKETA
jgi:hypothetical protein